MLVHKPREVSIESTRVNSWSNWSAEQYTAPRYGNVDDRAEEEEHDEFGKAALHDIILHPIVPSPAALGTTGGEVTAQVVAALDAVPVLAADETARRERTKCQ